MEPKLLIHVTYQAKPGRGREFVRQIVSQGLRILAEDGCLQYDYFFSSESDDTVLLVELWETAAHQAVHMTQPHMKALAELKERETLSTTIQKLPSDHAPHLSPAVRSAGGIFYFFS